MSRMDRIRGNSGGQAPITVGLARWDGVFTREAHQRIIEIQNEDFEIDRGDGGGRLRPSSLHGPCDRRKILSFLGHRSDPPPKELARAMEDGSWHHLKWQKKLLSAGIITEAEEKVAYTPWLLSGSIDGRMADGSGFELKTMNSWLYRNRITATNPETGMVEPYVELEHLWQIHGYMRAMRVNRFSLVYEDRGSGAFTEFAITYDSSIDEQLEANINGLLIHIEAGTMPAILPDCLAHRGDVYNDCLWKGACFLEG